MKRLFVNYTYKWWGLIIVLFTFLFAITGFLTIDTDYALAILFSLLGLSVGLILRTIDVQTNRVLNRIHNAELEIQAVSSLTQFKRTKLPLNIGDWAVGAHFLNRLIREIYLREPKLILECGSGTSTLVVSSCLKDLGQGRVISLDHLDKYAKQTRRFLEIEGLKNWANVVTAPLSKYELDIGTFEWYGIDLEDKISNDIELLVVDGPPGRLQDLSRYPAIPLLKDFLADRCLIMMDDSNRDDEKEIAKRWAEHLNADIEFNSNCKGYCLIDRNLNG